MLPFVEEALGKTLAFDLSVFSLWQLIVLRHGMACLILALGAFIK